MIREYEQGEAVGQGKALHGDFGLPGGRIKFPGWGHQNSSLVTLEASLQNSTRSQAQLGNEKNNHIRANAKIFVQILLP